MKGNSAGWRLKLATFSFLVITLAINCNNTPEKIKKPARPLAGFTPKSNKSVKFESYPIVLDTNKRYLFITFDDGPQPPGSTNCFNIFKHAGVKATFFNIADHVIGKEREDLVDSIRNGYPEYLLANHSKSHAFGDHYFYFYHHPREAAADFFACQQKLHIPFKIARLPGNSAWVRTGEVKASPLVKPVCLLLDSAGYNVIGWDEEWGFKTKNGYSTPVQSAETMARMINNDFAMHHSHTRFTLVWLAHDRMFSRPNFADSLYKCIAILKKDPRYIFETIDHYPGIKHSNN